MRRFWSLLMALALLGSLGLTAFASEGPLTMADVQVQLGQTVYLTVSLEEPVRGNTMGVSYSYDPEVLKIVPSECRWKKTGALQDFSAGGHEGVWATEKAAQLEGEICLLVFRLQPDAQPGDTQVSCELLIKDGPEEVGRYEAASVVSIVCAHSYGGWTENGEIFHVRSCSICGAGQSQSHTWGSPVTDGSQKISTCTVCSKKRVEQIHSGLQEVLPTQPPAPDHKENLPELTLPTVPEPTAPLPTAPDPESTRPAEPVRPTEPSGPTKPTEPTKPTKPTEPTKPAGPSGGSQQSGTVSPTEPSVYQPRDYNAPPETTAPGGEHIHTPEKTENGDNVIPLPTVKEEQPLTSEVKPVVVSGEQEKTAENSEENDDNTGIWVIAAVSAGAMAVLEWTRKKKQKHT